MVSKEAFLNYAKELLGQEKESVNTKYLNKSYGRSASIMLSVGIILIIVGFISLLVFLVVPGIILIVAGIARMVNVNKTVNYYKDNYREKLIEFLLKGYDYSFTEKDKIEEKVFKDSQFGGYYHDYKGADKLSINIPNDDGSKSNNYLTLCDLRVTRTERDSDGDSNTVVVYQGVFAYIYLPFQFKCRLCINSIYREKSVKLEKVSLEDINFNKCFSVYSNDQIEARYVLTPKMMENLLNLKDKLKTRIKITLADNKLFIGLCDEDFLELAKLDNEKVETIFEDLYDDINVILSIVNEIKNNNKVFKI